MKLKPDVATWTDVDCYSCPFQGKPNGCPNNCPTVKEVYGMLAEKSWQDRFKETYCDI